MFESELDLVMTRDRGSTCLLLGRTDNLCLAAELSKQAPTSPISKSGSIFFLLQIFIFYFSKILIANSHYRALC